MRDMNSITFSATAIAEIKRMQAKQKDNPSNFCITVKTGGCSGLYYDFSFVTDQDIADTLIYLDCHGISLVTDTQTINYLGGLNVDYSEDLMGGGFRFHNPNAIATCGCGNSFAVE